MKQKIIIEEKVIIDSNDLEIQQDINDEPEKEESGKLKARKKNKRNFYDFNYQKEEQKPKEKEYFEEELSNSEWNQIQSYVKDLYSGNKVEPIQNFLSNYPNLKKGDSNIKKLKTIFNQEISNYPKSIKEYQNSLNYIIDNFYIPKPCIQEVVFFPNEQNQLKVTNMIIQAKKTLDVCMFTMTNDKLYKAVLDAKKNGVNVRIITDDECVKQLGSDIYKLVINGVPVKTDDNAQFHMHHKFVVIDCKVILTGSFNWTVQAVKNNNENVLMLYNYNIAMEYTKEFERLWNLFNNEITVEIAKKNIK